MDQQIELESQNPKLNNPATFRTELEIYEGLDLTKCHYCDKKPEYHSPVCSNHRRCSQCTAIMVPEEINISVRNNVEPMHPRCAIEFSERFKLLSDSSVATIPRVYLDYLNQIRHFMEVNASVSEQTNESEAARLILSFTHVHQMSHEDIYLMTKRLEGAAAALHIILGKNKEKIRISARDKAQILSAQQVEQNKAAKKQEKLLKKSQKEIDKLTLAPKVNLKEMTTEEKSKYKIIQTLMSSLGMTEAEAIEEANKFKKRTN